MQKHMNLIEESGTVIGTDRAGEGGRVNCFPVTIPDQYSPWIVKRSWEPISVNHLVFVQPITVLFENWNGYSIYVVVLNSS